MITAKKLIPSAVLYMVFLLKSISVANIVDALLITFCTDNGLTRGRMNNNLTKWVTCLNCYQDGCDAKL